MTNKAFSLSLFIEKTTTRASFSNLFLFFIDATGYGELGYQIAWCFAGRSSLRHYAPVCMRHSMRECLWYIRGVRDGGQ